jgi:hypothetical protein
MDIKLAIGANPVVLDRLLLRIYGNLDANAVVEAEASSEHTLTAERLLVEGTPLHSLQFLAGPIPVEIDATLGLKAQVDMDFKAHGKASAGLRVKKHVEVGTEYRAIWNGFRPLSPVHHTDVLDFQEPTMVLGASASLKLSLIPELTLTLYKVAPIYFRIMLYIEADIAVGVGSGCWLLRCSLSTLPDILGSRL